MQRNRSTTKKPRVSIFVKAQEEEEFDIIYDKNINDEPATMVCQRNFVALDDLHTRLKAISSDFDENEDEQIDEDDEEDVVNLKANLQVEFFRVAVIQAHK